MSRTATLRTVAGLLVLQCLLVFAFVYPGYKPKRLLIASAASFTVTQLLRHAFTGATVEDVRPLDPDDPRGATINLLFGSAGRRSLVRRLRSRRSAGSPSRRSFTSGSAPCPAPTSR
jgi:hypothetical protein